MSYKIQESYVNRTKGYHYEDSAITETYIESLGELFKRCQVEFGRCEGKIFIEGISQSEPLQVGWIFVRSREYEGLGRYYEGDRTYIQEVWVTVFADDGD